MAIELGTPRTPRKRRGNGSGNGTEWLIGIGFGAFAGLITNGLPPAVPIILFALVAGGAMVLRVADVAGIARICLIGAAFTVPMNGFAAGPLELSDYLMGLAIGLYIVQRLNDGTRGTPGIYGPVMAGLGVMAVGGFIGAFFEPPGPYLYFLDYIDISGFGPNMANLSRFVLGSMGPMVLFVLARPGRREVLFLAAAFAAGQVFSGALGMITPIGANGRSYAANNRVVGLAGIPNQFGTLCMLSLALLAAVALSRKVPPAWLLAPAGVLLLGIYQSGSRAALGSAVVLLLLLGPITRSRVLMGGAVVGVALGLLFLASGQGDRVGGENAIARALSNTDTAEASDEARAEEHESLIALLESNYLTGAGFNYIRPSHNVYLGIAASTGVLGVAGFLWAIYRLGRRVWARRADTVMLAVATGYGAYLLTAWFDNILFVRWLWFYVALILALTATQPPLPNEEGATPRLSDLKDWIRG